jgi:hypothetical protein
MSRPAMAALLALLLMAIASLARADGRVEFLADRLRFPPATGQADDFRVRTSAALALGATNDDGAVVPLCGGLSDPSEVVRQAAAVALKRLGRPSELDCLRRRVGVETSSSVKAEIQRAIDAIDASGGGGGSSGNGGAGPPVVANARYYVALSSVTNNTSRATGDIERVVKDAITSKLSQLGEYQLAPTGESSGVAKAAIAKRKLKGYYLGISVEKFDYSDGNLRVRVRIAVFSYPGRDLRGEVPAGATLPGARPGDKGAEDQLLSVVAGQATDLFAQNFK